MTFAGSYKFPFGKARMEVGLFLAGT